MWNEWLHDPFMVSLTLSETGAWWRLYGLAHDCQAEGKLVSNYGTPLSMKAILETLHITNPGECRAFTNMVEKMVTEGRLHWEGQTLTITNYAAEQRKTPSEQPATVAERVRNYRERWDSFINDMNESLSALPPSVDRLAQHESIKQILADIGQLNGYEVQSEYPIGPPGPHGPKRIDLCWLTRGKIMAAFEIDYVSQKEGSIEKLNMAKTPNTFIILREPYIQVVRLKKREPEKKYSEEENTSVSNNTKTPDQECNGVTPVTSKGPVATNVTGNPLHDPEDSSGKLQGDLETLPGAVTGNPLQADPVIAEITRLYVENIGELPHGGVVIEDMVEFAANFRGDVKWIKLAFKEALNRNKRRWQYIRSILERWQEEGGPDGRAGQELERSERGDKPAPRRGLAADRPDPLEATRRGGWKVKRSGPAKPGSGDEKR